MTEEEDAELKVWMLEHVGRMAPGAVWRPDAMAESVNIGVREHNVMRAAPALSPEEAFRQELQEKQAIATSWTTEDGTRLVDLPLEEAYPEFIGEREVLLDDGETASIGLSWEPSAADSRRHNGRSGSGSSRPSRLSGTFRRTARRMLSGGGRACAATCAFLKRLLTVS